MVTRDCNVFAFSTTAKSSLVNLCIFECLNPIGYRLGRFQSIFSGYVGDISHLHITQPALVGLHLLINVPPDKISIPGLCFVLARLLLNFWSRFSFLFFTSAPRLLFNDFGVSLRLSMKRNRLPCF